MSFIRWSLVLAMSGVIAHQVNGSELGKSINGGWFKTITAAKEGDEEFLLDAVANGEAITKAAIAQLTEASASSKAEENQRLSSAIDAGEIPETREGEDFKIGELGALSKKFESKSDPAAIGWDKKGGWSYGAYQLSSNENTVKSFIVWLKVNGSKDFASTLVAAGGGKSAKKGTDSFKSAWISLSAQNDFYLAQRAFIRDTHYLVQANILRGIGLDISKRSHALRDVVWSSAVHHGGETNVITRVYKNGMSDADLIVAIYKERATRFPSSTKKVRASVRNRFVQEERIALGMVKYG